MYKISIYGCAMFKKLVCQWVKPKRFIPAVKTPLRFQPLVRARPKGFGTQNVAFRRGLRPEICRTLYCIISGKQKAA